MAGKIQRELHQTKAPRSLQEEASLNVVRTADVLMQADLLPAPAGPAVERPGRLLGVLLGVVVFVGLIAWIGTEVLT